jgi:hypothetical protein
LTVRENGIICLTIPLPFGPSEIAGLYPHSMGSAATRYDRSAGNAFPDIYEPDQS